MKIDIFLEKMAHAGDAYVYYISPVSNKPKYHICTLELDECAYIRDKQQRRGNMPEPRSGQIRAFCWDLNDFKNIDVNHVTAVVPLANMMKQNG